MRRKSDCFVMNSTKSLKALPYWVGKRTYNAVSGPHHDCHGRPYLGLQHVHDPKAERGAYDRAGIVLFFSHEHFERAQKIILEHMKD